MKLRRAALVVATTFILAVGAVIPDLFAQQDFDAVEIDTIEVADGVYMLMGAGGNIGLSVGDDGAFVVDDQFAPLTDKIRAAIAAVTDAEVKFVVNTHWHGDHTGGNEAFGSAGAMIVAHDNVRKRMNPEQFGEVMGSTEQAPPAALPVVTFSDEVTFYWNDEKIQVEHVRHAHTDGDALIWFTGANVVHMGDNFFNGVYPYIDVDSGGNVDGMLASARQVLARIDSDTKIIPGHGALAGAEELRRFRDVLTLARDRVGAMINDGMSLEEVIAALPMSDHDEAWGGGFMSPDRFLTVVYRSIAGE